MDKLWDALGSGSWLDPNDHDALRKAYNRLAEAAEDVVLTYDRITDIA